MTDTPLTITDSHVLAAMSHPARRRLLDVLHVEGPSTVSMLATRTGMAIGGVSHHLKSLSLAALVEEAPELARDRREHWWRIVNSSTRWSSTSFDSDAATVAVIDAAQSLNLDHQISKVRAWQAQSGAAEKEWLDAAFSTDTWLRLTPEELQQLSEEINTVLSNWYSRLSPDDAQARELVFVFARGVPAQP